MTCNKTNLSISKDSVEKICLSPISSNSMHKYPVFQRVKPTCKGLQPIVSFWLLPVSPNILQLESCIFSLFFCFQRPSWGKTWIDELDYQRWIKISYFYSYNLTRKVCSKKTVTGDQPGGRLGRSSCDNARHSP
jgi:hypothetical protein